MLDKTSVTQNYLTNSFNQCDLTSQCYERDCSSKGDSINPEKHMLRDNVYQRTINLCSQQVQTQNLNLYIPQLLLTTQFYNVSGKALIKQSISQTKHYLLPGLIKPTHTYQQQRSLSVEIILLNTALLTDQLTSSNYQ